MATILIYLEMSGEALSKSELGLIGLGKQLSGESPLILLLDSPNEPSVTSELFRYGVDLCYCLSRRTDDAIWDVPEILTEINKQHHASLVMGIASVRNKEILSAFAAKLGCTAVHDCDDIHITESSERMLSKVLFGGKINARFTQADTTKPTIASVKPPHMELESSSIPTKGKVVQYENEKMVITGLTLTNQVRRTRKRPELEDAEIIISGGRGIKNREEFAQIDQLADLLNAAVGASRAIVDEGIAEEEIQIGQTGKNVKPKLYVAVGISGAPQHIAGIRKSQRVIAINKDPNAEIFKYSDYGIIGDSSEILSGIINELTTNKN